MYTVAEERRYLKQEENSRLKRKLEGKPSTWKRSRESPLIQTRKCTNCSEDVHDREVESDAVQRERRMANAADRCASLNPPPDNAPLSRSARQACRSPT